MSSFWAQFLYMAELTQARYYFRHFKHDDWKLKVCPIDANPFAPEPSLPQQTLVLVAFLIDTASTVGDYACVYLVSTRIIIPRSQAQPPEP